MNTDLMDMDGCSRFRRMWEGRVMTKHTHIGGVDTWFAEGLDQARELFMQIGKDRARARRKQETDHRNQIAIMDRIATKDPSNPDHRDMLNTYKQELKALMQYRNKGAHIRAKEHDDHLNETCSAWFFRQEKVRGGASEIRSLKEFDTGENGRVQYKDTAQVDQAGMQQPTRQSIPGMHNDETEVNQATHGGRLTPFRCWSPSQWWYGAVGAGVK